MKIYYLCNIKVNGDSEGSTQYLAVGFTRKHHITYNAHSTEQSKRYLNRYDFIEASNWKPSVNGRDETMLVYFQ